MSKGQTERQKKIQIWLIEQGLTQAGIARRLSVTPQHLHFWIKGDRISGRIRRFFVEELGCPEEIADLEPQQAGG